MFSEYSTSSGVSFWNILTADVFFGVILTARRFLYIIHVWNLFQPFGRNARSSQMGFRGQQLAYSHEDRGLYNNMYVYINIYIYHKNFMSISLIATD